MFFKELACFILFSYQCSFAVLICFVCDSFVIISCAAFFVNNFFQLFLILFSLFQRRLLKLISVFVDLLLPCSATLVNIHLTSTKVNIIFKNIFKKAFWPMRTIYHSFFMHFVHFYSSNIILQISSLFHS